MKARETATEEIQGRTPANGLRIRTLFPGCAGRERAIAEFACRKYSGRVGRSAAAKRLDEVAVRLAVIAHVRHTETDYDTLLGRGVDRYDARRMVQGRIEKVLLEWEAQKGSPSIHDN
jgi:hypothetical protein